MSARAVDRASPNDSSSGPAKTGLKPPLRPSWKPVHGAASYVPTSGERRGKPAVGTFFKQVAENVNFQRFEPKEFVATGDRVVAIGHYTATTPIGKSFDSDFVMVFTLKDGKVVEFQEFSDSAAINAAYAVPAAV